MKQLLVSFLTISVLWSCHNDTTSIAKKSSAYFWETSFLLDSIENAFLTTNSIDHIYCRFFDLALNPKTNEVFPVATIDWNQRAWEWDITPVVFIKNDIWEQQTEASIKQLASKTIQLIQEIAEENHLKIFSCQLDCDWSLGTQKNYFAFIEECKKLNPTWKWSATIRLHQIKYRESTGVPPVNEGMLMYYNMGKISSDGSNSILDNAIGEQYLHRLNEYPIPLSAALPIFSWAIHVRNESVVQLISEWDLSILNRDSAFHRIDNQRYECIAAGFYNGAYLRKGDQLKLEKIDPQLLNEASVLLEKYYNQSFEEVAFFDLDSKHISQFDDSFFQSFSSTIQEK